MRILIFLLQFIAAHFIRWYCIRPNGTACDRVECNGTYYETFRDAFIALPNYTSTLALCPGNYTYNETSNWVQTSFRGIPDSNGLNPGILAHTYLQFSLYVNSTVEHLIENMTFLNGNNSGGAIRMTKIMGRTFATGLQLKVSNCHFENFRAVAGAAIQATGDSYSIEVQQSTFINNTETAVDYGGGAIYSNVHTNIGGCLFQNNVAINSGGAIIVLYAFMGIRNCTFIENTAHGANRVTPYQGGGAIAFVHGNFTVEKSTFLNNTAKYAAGGIWFNGVHSGFSGVVDGCTFDNQKLTGSVGNYLGAVVVQNFTAKMTNNLFLNNIGGGLFANSGEITITNSTFIRNQGGGALLSKGTFAVSDSHFFRNNNTYGGALFIESTSVIKNCNFTENSASENGGAIYLNITAGVVHLLSGIFVNNSAFGHGGAIASYTPNCSHLVEGSLEFHGNYASDYGNDIATPATTYKTETTNFVIGKPMSITWTSVDCKNSATAASREGASGAIGVLTMSGNCTNHTLYKVVLAKENVTFPPLVIKETESCKLDVQFKPVIRSPHHEINGETTLQNYPDESWSDLDDICNTYVVEHTKAGCCGRP